ncbi:hypothetical protein COL940_014413 [Colletotrichum noveboracense]|nr:hypothetical protein COL940_014413 [Colletotrichum noveboracense]
MAKLETPPSFLAYIEHAIKIDNRLYERRKERGEKQQNPNSGHYGRMGYNMTILEIKKKTLAMAYRSNSKMARKTVEQLDEML